MSETGLLLSLMLIAGVAAWVLIPLVGGRGQRASAAMASVTLQRERLQVYYERVLRNIHDLDEDYATGKLNHEEYAREREAWVQRGTQALSALDELDAQHLLSATSPDQATLDAEIEAAIEARVRAFRAGQAS